MGHRVRADLMCAALLASCVLLPGASQAQSPADADKSLWERDTLLGDAGPVRPMLADHGVTVSLTDTADVMGNLGGGLRRGATYEAATLLSLRVDTDKAFGLAGGQIYASALNIRGRDLSAYYLGNIQIYSGIAAQNATRLFELWYQQDLIKDQLTLRLGQQSLDQEFMISPSAALFVNAAMGWAALPSANMYAGGPAYPLSSLGVRLRADGLGPFTVLGGVFQDNPPGGPFAADSQLLGSTRWGGNFNLRTGAIVISEVQYALNPPPAEGQPATGLAGSYRIGAWYDSGTFYSPRYDTQGVALASPASNGVPRAIQNNYAFYALADQQVWHGDGDDAPALNLFARVEFGPGNRNALDFSLNAGMAVQAPFAGRANDSFGIGYGIAAIGSAATGFDRDTAFYSGAATPVRSNEQFIEVTYQAQITPWFTVQPDFQYVIRPGGGIANPQAPGMKLKNETVVGVRSIIVV